jgi:anti-sigma regulatory factor (Ser/Thr protein kinase)
VDADVEYREWETTLPAGSTVVLYTDGLVERRERPIDAGLELLAETAAGPSRQPEALLDDVLAALLEEGRLADDVAVLAFRLDEARLEPLDLTLPAGTESLTSLRGELERWLEQAAIPDFDARDVVLAAWEAAANAIEHAQSPADGLVRVRATLTGDRVRVEVADSGRWKEQQPREDRGLGLRLMCALMTVDIDRSDEGTRVVMERPLTRERVGGHAADPSHG